MRLTRSSVSIGPAASALLSFGLGLALFLSSCTPKQTIAPPETLFSCSAPAPDQLSPDLTAQIYLDATSSMQGFAKPQFGQDFVVFLQQLERAFATGWKSPQLKFWKFGDGKRVIADRPVYSAASKMAFYEDAPLSWKTRMDQVLRTASTGTFTVVVTDLFQDESDEVSVVAALKDVTLNQRLSVGILGIRARFDGVVYDIGPGASAAPYKGQRPFYALLIGRTADILHYVKQLSGLGGLDSDRHFLLLSPQLSDVPVGTSLPKVSRTPVGLRLRNSNPGNCPYSRLEFLGSHNKTDSSVVLDYKWEPKPYTPQIDFRNLPEPAVSVVRLWQKQRDPYPAGAKAIGVKVRPAAHQLQTAITIPAGAFTQPGIYAIKISLRTTPEAFSLPTWCQDWSMRISKLAEAAQKPTAFDGTKTLNLREFLGDLWSAMINQNEPTLGDTYIYLSRDARW